MPSRRDSVGGGVVAEIFRGLRMPGGGVVAEIFRRGARVSKRPVVAGLLR